jgi:hypothetical protein
MRFDGRVEEAQKRIEAFRAALEIADAEQNATSHSASGQTANWLWKTLEVKSLGV